MHISDGVLAALVSFGLPLILIFVGLCFGFRAIVNAIIRIIDHAKR